MAKIKRRAAGKAAKLTAKHAVHGTASKTKRDPVRSAALVAAGAAIGAGATWVASRARRPSTPQFQAAPTPS